MKDWIKPTIALLLFWWFAHQMDQIPHAWQALVAAYLLRCVMRSIAKDDEPKA